LMVLATLIALSSWIGVSQGTSGVAGMAFACFLAIGARIVQAGQHHKEIAARLRAPGTGQPLI
jgi:hypothetical protein